MSCVAAPPQPTWLALIPAIAAALAAITFLFSVYKQRADITLQRELEAKRRWTAFMDLAFQNPSVAFKPNYTWISLPDIERGERPIQDVEHKNFIARFLFTAEEVLQLAPSDREWIASIKSQMYCHERYFRDDMQDHQIACYSTDLQRVIREWRQELAAKGRSGSNA